MMMQMQLLCFARIWPDTRSLWWFRTFRSNNNLGVCLVAVGRTSLCRSSGFPSVARQLAWRSEL